MLVGVGDRLGSVADSGLGEEMVDVSLDGGFVDEEPFGDLSVGQAFGHQAEYFAFSRREPVWEACGNSGLAAGWAVDDDVQEVMLNGGVDGRLAPGHLAQGQLYL